MVCHTCQLGWRGWRTCVGGVLAWVVWVVCLRVWRASVLAWMVWVADLRGWRANLGYVVDMLAWVTCNKGDVVGVPAWVSWLMCQREWRTEVNSVGAIGRNIGSELDSVVGSTLLLELFPKTDRK